MIGIYIKRINFIQNHFTRQIQSQQSSALTKLQAISPHLFNALEQTYLNDVIQLFSQPDFLIKSPTHIQQYKNQLGPIPPNSRFYRNGKAKKTLKQYILDALEYKNLRTRFYPTYFQKVGIKACVYCNSSLTITVTNQNNINIAKFDVDHYYSKDEYPFLSISLFNLYPACASCNRKKRTKKVELELYTDNVANATISNFGFTLDPYAKSLYLSSKDHSVIKFTFYEPIVPVGSETFQDTFNVQEIYETQKDIVEELIIKSQIYNTNFKKTLRNNFSKLSLNPKFFERILIGNYVEDKDLHKRPLAKFTQDIARQLGLI